MDSYKFICTFLACVSRCGVKPETCVTSFPRPQNELMAWLFNGQLFVRKHEWNWVVSAIWHFRHNLRQKDFLVLAKVVPLANERAWLCSHVKQRYPAKVELPSADEWVKRRMCERKYKEKDHSKYGGVSLFRTSILCTLIVMYSSQEI